VREAVQRWRLVLARGRLAGEAGQREQLAAWEEALTGSGLPVAGLDAVPPKPRFATAAPLAAGIAGEAELVDVWLTERVPAWRVREALQESLPAGHTLLDAFDVWPGAPALPGQVVASVYRVTVSGADRAALEAACARLLAAPSLPRERPKGQGTVRYDLRPFLDALVVAEGGHELRMILRHDPERGIGRPEEVVAALSDAVAAPLEVGSIVRESLVLAPPPSPAAATRGRAPRSRQAAASTSRPRK
jgi:radical SAM-linked protein